MSAHTRRRAALFFGAGWRRRVWLALVMCLAASAGPEAAAHFQLNANIRIIHVAHEPEGLRVFFRLPLPFLVARLYDPEGGVEAPYITSYEQDGQVLHRFNPKAFRSDPLGLGALVAGGHRIETKGRLLAGKVAAVRAYPALQQPPFSNLVEARTALSGPLWRGEFGAPFAGDTVVDAEIFYPGGGGSSYRLSGASDPGLPGQNETANIIADHGGETRVFRERGLLLTPIHIDRSALAAALTFTKSGIRHLFEGLDHVMFLVCLALGAAGLRGLVWRVTGFTLGHALTVTFGFLGWAPSAAWFTPVVEAAIALSIVYAGAAALMSAGPGGGAGGGAGGVAGGGWRSETAGASVTAALGLVHGFGVSFVLTQILRLDAPNLWTSLLAFNAGIEIGQLAIVLACWPLFFYAAKWSPRAGQTLRWSAALPCVGVAAWWSGERLLSVWAAL